MLCVARMCSADPIPTFTGYYEGAAYDEREYARLVAYAEDHHEIQITPEDFVEHFDAMLRAARPPYQGMGTFGQYMVAEYASLYVDKVLSGEGSDELFGGYARQYIVAGLTPPDGYEDYELPEGYPRDPEKALDWDLARLPNLLAVDEQMTAAFGLEAAAPFTDEAIVDFALDLEPLERIGKPMLKQAMRGIVPDAILDRTDKMGFPAPLVEWAQREPVKSFVKERIGYLPDADKPWERSWWVESVREIGAAGRGGRVKRPHLGLVHNARRAEAPKEETRLALRIISLERQQRSAATGGRRAQGADEDRWRALRL